MADRQAAVNILGWVFLIASGAMVALRLLSRLKLSDLKGWDDLWLMLAWIVIFIDTCLASYATSLGLGVPLKTLIQQGDVERMVQAIKWSVITLAGNIFVFTFPKPAIAILLGRILKIGDSTPKTQRIVLYGPSALIVSWSFATCGVWLGQCHPVRGFWDKRVSARCLDPHVFLGVGMGISTTSAFLDFFYAIYPVFFISKLQMSFRRKINISIMLGLGCIGGAVAVWKLTQLPAGVNPDADVTYDSAALVYATLIEGNVIIIMSCVPTIGPVVHAIRARTKSFKERYGMTPSNYLPFAGDTDTRHQESAPIKSDASNSSTDAIVQSAKNAYELQERDIRTDGMHGIF